jgi:hypothetical protein
MHAAFDTILLPTVYGGGLLVRTVEKKSD